MASCAYCKTTIIFGGKKQGELRFCNAECESKGILFSVAKEIPMQEVKQAVAIVHSGECPRCNGSGPVDVHTSHRVYSALLFTSWSSRPTVCCQRCGTKRKIEDTFFSLILGWWGVPWGVLVTPMQIVKNIYGIFRTPNPKKPSANLEQMIRLNLAANSLESRSSETHRV